MHIRDSIVETLPVPLRRSLRQLTRNVALNWRNLTKPTTITHHGIRLRIGSHMSPNIIQSIYEGSYEGGELKPLRLFLEPDDVVMEIGTGIGFVTLFCARKVGSNQVFTYEANPENEVHIRENFALNGLQPSLTIGLLAEEAGEARFYVEPQFWSSSTIYRSAEAREIRVPKIPIRDEIWRINPTTLVIDAEGGEHEIIDIIDFHDIRKIIIEMHPYIIGPEKTATVRRKIEAAGFRCEWTSEDKDHHFFSRETSDPERLGQ
jgi:FkbM family methyltransferase